MKDAVVVLFSGGLDSAYALHYYLSQTDRKVYAHHIDFRYNSSLESVAEKIAVEKLHAIFKQSYRAYSKSSSVFHINSLDASDQTEYQLFAGWQLAKKVAYGITGKVYLGFGWYFAGSVDSYYVHKAKRGIYGQPRKLWKSYIKASPQNIRDRLSPNLLQPFRKRAKAQFVKELPVEITQAVWSCKSPMKNASGFKPCGACNKCDELRRAIDANH